MRIVKVLGIVLLILLPIYIGSYVVISAHGRYEPEGIGLGGVKSYAWAPSGFAVGYKRKVWPMYVYAPLYILDQCIWHTQAKADSGLYPVDVVKREDIWKVYQAYGFFDQRRPTAEADKPPK